MMAWYRDNSPGTVWDNRFHYKRRPSWKMPLSGLTSQWCEYSWSDLYQSLQTGSNASPYLLFSLSIAWVGYIHVTIVKIDTNDYLCKFLQSCLKYWRGKCTSLKSVWELIKAISEPLNFQTAGGLTEKWDICDRN